MEVTNLLTCYKMVFDQASELDGDEHAAFFVFAFKKYFEFFSACGEECFTLPEVFSPELEKRGVEGFCKHEKKLVMKYFDFFRQIDAIAESTYYTNVYEVSFFFARFAITINSDPIYFSAVPKESNK